MFTGDVLSYKLPQLRAVRQYFQVAREIAAHQAVIREFSREDIRNCFKPGQRIAVAVGSRGIANLSTIVKSIIDLLIALETHPFIVPAMGSHGQAAPEGQRKVLADLGITAESMGVPVISSLEVVQIGDTPDGIPVYMDKNAWEADLVVPVARIKPHTAYTAPIESGICKMLAIGLGNHLGCSRIHQEGFERFPELIPSVANVFLEKARIGPCFAILENAYDDTALIQALPPGQVMREEPVLLAKAKVWMPSIMIPEIDVLVVDHIGKNISGPGMDPNITGRNLKGRIPNFRGPQIEQLVVLDLTPETRGSFTGLGYADFTTQTVLKKMDFTATYANALAAGCLRGAYIPPALDTAREAILAGVYCGAWNRKDQVRIVRILNTLHLETIWVSESLIPFVEANPKLEMMDLPPLNLDELE